MEIGEHVVPGYERVVWGRDAAAGYHGMVAIHSTVLGPALGGTRYWHYAKEADALNDLLRLARGMTYKNALAGLPCGGGKSIILRGAEAGQGKEQNREALFRAHGKLIETLAGKYITAEDVGTSPSDMEYILQETQHVAGLQGRSGDPSPHTSRGVYRAMQAAAQHRWGSDDLAGMTVALQGCGHVGYYLARELHQAGARVIASDVDPQRVERVVREFAAQPETPDNIYGAGADIFAPCALGGILNDQTIPRLRVAIVAGGANNQLLEPRHGDLLEQRGILYAPDYAANAGGVIHGSCMEMLGWDSARARRRIDETIYETILRIIAMAGASGIATYLAADRLVEERLAQGPTDLRAVSRSS
jgi:leucine dehydrogenase